MTVRFRRLLDGLWGDLRGLDERGNKLDNEITAIATSKPAALRLQQLRVVDPMIATALVVALGDPRQFTNGRQEEESIYGCSILEKPEP